MPVGPRDHGGAMRSVECYPAGTTPASRVVDRGPRAPIRTRARVAHLPGIRTAWAQRCRAVWRADGARTNGLILRDGRDWGESGVRAWWTAAWGTSLAAACFILGMGHDFRRLVATGVISVPVGLEDGRRGKEYLAYDGEACESVFADLEECYLRAVKKDSEFSGK
ncbi:hypothetical protein DFH09DRAFT_1077858 [Mycena vulgaris]|nr:hypothetical protein DFH09DRAFT_1077858 [Mycena vulgaris]